MTGQSGRFWAFRKKMGKTAGVSPGLCGQLASFLNHACFQHVAKYPDGQFTAYVRIVSVFGQAIQAARGRNLPQLRPDQSVIAEINRP